MSVPFKTIFSGVSISKEDWARVKRLIAAARQTVADLGDAVPKLAGALAELDHIADPGKKVKP